MKENKNNLIQIPLSKNRFRHSLALAGFIILLGVGLFGSAGKARATECNQGSATEPAGCTPMGTCTLSHKTYAGDETGGSYETGTVIDFGPTRLSDTQCTAERAKYPADSSIDKIWKQESLAGSQAAIAAGQKSPFDAALKEESCGIIMQGSIAGCAKQFFYYVVYTPSAVLLSIAAQFFNALINIALSSALFSASSAFLSTAWGTVRDLSNIFFILILLYIAIKIILDMGGHDAKKMIAKVIIIALLINFSMFFTQVIIDSSNILALIFYNKLDVTYKDANGNTAVRPYGGTAGGATGAGEKDIAGSMYNGFDITSKLDAKFWESTKGTPPQPPQPYVPTGTAIGVILVAAAIMLFAAYAFFISGIAFVARVIELFVLIIFSPFAFMSSTVPLFSGVEYIGWDFWIKRLFKVAFMAPIFMFFMYLIFLLLNAKLFGALVTVKNDWVQTILGVIIPGVMILVLLLKATEYAKKGSGVIGEKLMAGAKVVGGLALGAATGGTAFLASNSAGRIARNIANDDELKAKAAGGDKGAQRKLTLANSFANKSFDIRQTGLGKLAAKQSGMDFNAGLGVVGLGTENLKGGRRERDKEVIEKHEEKVKSYELSKSGAEKQDALAKDKSNPQNIRAAQYETDLKEARGKGFVFNEKSERLFKRDYAKGDDLRKYGLDKKVEAGSVEKIKDARGVNKERRQAYALSLENPDKKIVDGKAIKKGLLEGSGSSFVSGAAGMLTTPAGLALSAATLGLAIPIGGLAAAIKDLANAKLQANKYTGVVFAEHADTVAAVRKGVSPDDKLSALIKKAAGKDENAATEAVKEIVKDAKTANDEKKDNATGNTGAPAPGAH